MRTNLTAGSWFSAQELVDYERSAGTNSLDADMEDIYLRILHPGGADKSLFIRLSIEKN